MGGTPQPVRPCEPFGASTRRVLAEIGYAPDEIECLIDNGIAVGAAPATGTKEA